MINLKYSLKIVINFILKFTIVIIVTLNLNQLQLVYPLITVLGCIALVMMVI